MFLYRALGHGRKAEISQLYLETAKTIFPGQGPATGAAEGGAEPAPRNRFRVNIPYILGRVNEALDALLRADAIARTGGGGGVIDASVFLAMVHAARGEISDAELRLAEARALSQAPRTQAHTKRLVEEAAQRVEEAGSKR